MINALRALVPIVLSLGALILPSLLEDLSLSLISSSVRPSTASAAPATQPRQDDYLIPGGGFFTQALPGRDDGAGFAVQDGHGAKLWSSFLARGGVTSLGYPVSRRFEWDGMVAQAFEHGVLRWNTEAQEAELLSAEAIPWGKPPDYAIEPDLPPLAFVEVWRKPWSGWWWPASTSVGPTLFDPDGPLAKYDQYVERATGTSPGSRDWEEKEASFPDTRWAGHCNGWAAAALLEPEPADAHELLGVLFTPGDQKALLSAYHFADAAAWSFGHDGELNPADFHRVLLTWLGERATGFVITFDLGDGEFWSYPVYRFETSWGLDPEEPGIWRVKTTVWMADMEVSGDFVGLSPYPGPEGKSFEYLLEGDPRNPSGGAWTGASRGSVLDRPGRVWFPEPRVRELAGPGANPNLDRAVLDQILGAS